MLKVNKLDIHLLYVKIEYIFISCVLKVNKYDIYLQYVKSEWIKYLSVYKDNT